MIKTKSYKAALVFLILLVQSNLMTAQQKQYQVYTAAFYNLENLFDTEADPAINDTEFTPAGSNRWTTEKYNKKQANMAKVISRLGKKYSQTGPAFIGLCELENRRVLEDLVAQPALAATGYGIVHYDSPDRRGVDVALLYNPALFKVKDSKTFAYHIKDMAEYRTRDILLVKGQLAGEDLHVLVNHWPSRYGGKSSELREHAATIVRKVVDSLYAADDKAKVVIMGDLNDDPTDKSVRVVLGAKKYQNEVEKGGLFNTMWQHYDRGIGSLGYQGKWNLFDQIIVSEPLLGEDKTSLKFWKSEIFNPEFLITQEGRYKGYPFRTFSGNVFQNGFSDHFPTLIYLVKELK
ncbi:endonuclease/exonuclease/phosphatase family protein [Elizabethkingia sp. HX QKY]|uniref:endonuclease/exonuclease/phosphatase family protein n=1 Tax=Elizabethkingia TaxID=308865 RepID=UPI002A241322|nr:endonuclease/exonuclease/phosphatase family protein [Elizabethkingia sp. HX QKY]MDX8570832.1 endonuclease/exonuclease/phosphatase family protein [Elizabethkingia sp. HX QKY]